MSSSYYSKIRQHIMQTPMFLFGLSKAFDIGNSIEIPINPLESLDGNSVSDAWKQVGEDMRKALGDYSNE